METLVLERHSGNRIISLISYADGVVVVERGRPSLLAAVFLGLGLIFSLSMICAVFYIEWVSFRSLDPGGWTSSGNWLCCLMMVVFILADIPAFSWVLLLHVRLFGSRVTLRRDGDRVTYRMKSGLIGFSRVLSPRNFAAVRYFFTSRHGWICCAHIGGSFPERIFLLPAMPLTDIHGSATGVRKNALLISDILRRNLGIEAKISGRPA